MEVPEKIYLYPSDRAGEEYETEWGDKPWGEGCVEYTCTDAFIEKACDWLSKHAKKYYFNKERYLGTEELVEDFKLSMEMWYI